MTWNADYNVMSIEHNDMYIGPRVNFALYTNYYRQYKNLSRDTYHVFVFSSRLVSR